MTVMMNQLQEQQKQIEEFHAMLSMQAFLSFCTIETYCLLWCCLRSYDERKYDERYLSFPGQAIRSL